MTENEKVADITPEWGPSRCMKSGLEEAQNPDAIGAFYAVFMKDGSVTFDVNGKDLFRIVWALERTKHRLMHDEGVCDD